MPPFCSMIEKMDRSREVILGERIDKAHLRGYEAGARCDRAWGDCVCSSEGKSYTYGEAEYIGVKLNSGMYKNAFTCGIPNSLEVGSAFAAALGVIAGKDELGLEALSDVMPEDTKRAKRLIEQEKVEVILKNISSRIFIEVRVKTAFDEAVVTIQDAHTNITKIVVNGEKKLEKSEEVKAQNVERDGKQIHPVYTSTVI